MQKINLPPGELVRFLQLESHHQFVILTGEGSYDKHFIHQFNGLFYGYSSDRITDEPSPMDQNDVAVDPTTVMMNMRYNAMQEVD